MYSQNLPLRKYEFVLMLNKNLNSKSRYKKNLYSKSRVGSIDNQKKIDIR